MKFSPDSDVAALDGKVIFVTGGNVGLGRETIFQLAKHNPSRIFLAARNRLKAETAIEQLKQDLPLSAPAIEFIELDLTSFESIKLAANDFNALSDRLDILINNAGIMGHTPGTTKEGYEIHFGTNHIGHALLTKLLMPKLRETASNPGADVRIVNVSSGAYCFSPNTVYPLTELQGELRSLSWWTRYAMSKLANIHFTKELAKHDPSITCVAIHPGSVSTNIGASVIGRHPWFTWPLKIFINLITVSVQKGALCQVWAATAKDVKSGAYYSAVGKEHSDNKISNSEAAQELWTWTEKQLQKYVEDSHISS